MAKQKNKNVIDYETVQTSLNELPSGINDVFRHTLSIS